MTAWVTSEVLYTNEIFTSIFFEGLMMVLGPARDENAQNAPSPLDANYDHQMPKEITYLLLSSPMPLYKSVVIKLIPNIETLCFFFSSGQS